MVYNCDLIILKFLGGWFGWNCCIRLKENRKLKLDKNRR